MHVCNSAHLEKTSDGFDWVLTRILGFGFWKCRNEFIRFIRQVVNLAKGEDNSIFFLFFLSYTKMVCYTHFFTEPSLLDRKT